MDTSFFTPDIIMKLCGIVVLALFIPLSALSFYLYRLPKKEKEYNKIKEVLGLKETEASLQIPTVKDEYTAIDYALPIVFATILCLLGSTALLLGMELEIANTTSLIFSGINFDSETNTVIAYQQQSLLVMSMSFIGAYIWSAQNIFRRLVTIDLPPGAYYNVGIRIIFSVLVALMLHHFLAAIPGKDYTEDLLPVMAFLTGMFPERAIHYLKEKIPIFSDSVKGKADALPLEMIEGINTLHKIRLAEVGIDNAQNLAVANLVELIVRTPFRTKQLIDWIAQAKLYISFTNHLDKLREFGIRNIFDLKINGDIEGRLHEIAESTSIPELHLTLVYQTIKDNPTVDRLFKAEKTLSLI